MHRMIPRVSKKGRGMAKPDSAVEKSPAAGKGKKYFTLEEARRALPLIKRIAADVQTTQAERLRLHAQLSSGVTEFSTEATLELQDQLEGQTNRLEELVEELSQIGVELKDPARALLDFPSLYRGREVLLCWKGDEETITHWHEVDAGFNGRRPVEELVNAGR